jgi:YcxB-like protein
MEVQYTLRIEDFEEITRAAYSAHPRQQRIRWALLLIGIAVLILPFVGVRGPLHPEWSLLPLFPFAMCFIYYGLQTPNRIARKKYGRLLSQEEYKAEISENGIITTSRTVRTELKWEAFSQSIGGDGAIALVHRALMYVFPRRAFTDEQWQEFMRLIREHISRES